LTDGGSYLVVIGPDTSTLTYASQRLCFDYATDPYLTGYANSISAVPPTIVTTTGANPDFLFFATALDGHASVLPSISASRSNTISHTVIDTKNSPVTSYLQARFTNSGDYRAMTQSFQWVGNGMLNGLGFHLSGSQAAFTTDQTYRITIYSTAGWIYNSAVNSTVFDSSFTLSGNIINSNAAGNYLYFDLSSSGISLTDGGSYLVVIGPDTSTLTYASQRLCFDYATDPYLTGYASAISAVPPTIVTTTGANPDFSIFCHHFGRSRFPFSGRF
jgi:hypothetical protein